MTPRFSGSFLCGACTGQGHRWNLIRIPARKNVPGPIINSYLLFVEAGDKNFIQIAQKYEHAGQVKEKVAVILAK